MRVYMTNGTLSFLIKLVKKHPNIKFFFMRNEQGVLVYYEGAKKKVFSAGRTFQTLQQVGTIKQKGYVMTEHVPIQGDSKPLFERQLPSFVESLAQATGIIAVRILKQRWRNHYVIFTQWENKSDYETWEEQREQLEVKKPAYFLNRQFKTEYFLIDEEELDELRKNI